MKKHDARDWRTDLRRQLDPLIRKAGVVATARKIGASGPTIHRWLDGHSSIGEEKLRELAGAFGFEIVTKIQRSKP